MNEILLGVIIGVASTATVAVLLWLWKAPRDAWNTRRIRNWLEAHYSGKNGQYEFASTKAISDHLRIPQDEVRRLCLAEEKAIRPNGSHKNPDSWGLKSVVGEAKPARKPAPASFDVGIGRLR